jgi:hypothetical protein
MRRERPVLNNCQVRVFISSTFRDMHAERYLLVTVVFPELRERVSTPLASSVRLGLNASGNPVHHKNGSASGAHAQKKPRDPLS